MKLQFAGDLRDEFNSAVTRTAPFSFDHDPSPHRNRPRGRALFKGVPRYGGQNLNEGRQAAAERRSQ